MRVVPGLDAAKGGTKMRADTPLKGENSDWKEVGPANWITSQVDGEKHQHHDPV